MTKITTVDGYIKAQAKAAQPILRDVRILIKKASPKAEESISYGMAGYKLYGKPLVYFGAWKSHIGFYATPSAHAEFKKEMTKYTGAKGSVRFPLDEKIPYPLIKKMVQFRTKQLTKEAAAKKAKK